jgi:hypothetical protein
MKVQGPGTDEFKQSYWSKALNRSQGLYMRVQDPKIGTLRLNLDGTCFGGKINWFKPKKTMLKGELLIWRTKESG